MKLQRWQRLKNYEANWRGPKRFSCERYFDEAPARPRSATFRPERFHEPEPMPEPRKKPAPA